MRIYGTMIAADEVLAVGRSIAKRNKKMVCVRTDLLRDAHTVER